VEYVLAPLSPEERERLTVVVDHAADAVIHILDCGVEEAMNRFNGRDLLGAAEAGSPATP
jgi:peptidyl-tRNA hydrolase